jgi:hypothetical protein
VGAPLLAVIAWVSGLLERAVNRAAQRALGEAPRTAVPAGGA